jgi:predicted MFS family arabinose efflux permease
MQTVALGVYLTETTHDALWLGLLTVCAWTPALIGAPLGGVIADRVLKQRWIQANNLVMALTSSALATAELTHRLSPHLACYLAIVEGLCSSGSQAAWQSLLPDLVDHDEVFAAMSLSSAQYNLGRIIGPLLAGMTLAFASPGICFAINAASFAFVVIMFSFVRSAPRPRPTTSIRLWIEMKDGAKRAWSVKGCRYPIIGIGTVAIIASPFIALVPAMAIQTLHSGQSGVAWLVAAQGVGAVIGAVLLPAVARRRSRIVVLRWSLAAVAIALTLYGTAPTLAFAVASFVLLGGAYVGTLTGLVTAVQLHAPAGERSRILSLYSLSFSLLYPLGALAQAAVAQTRGVRLVTLCDAGLLASAVAFVSLWRPEFWREIAVTPDAPVILLAD